MPEQISKYPDVTLQVLRESGAVCSAKNPETMPAGPFLFTSNRGNLCVWHQ